MKNTVIFDIDGTLALNDKRCDLATKFNGKFNFGIFHEPSNIKLDEPNYPVIKMIQLFKKDGFNILIFSGRPDSLKEVTIEWLLKYEVPFDKLIMRDVPRHFMHDDILKKQMLDDHVDIDDVFCVVDDRQKVVDMWREIGLTCFQVAPGNF
jgi:phosphoglycolate phosphatase-like HAD superfamily hydrolase